MAKEEFGIIPYDRIAVVVGEAQDHVLYYRDDMPVNKYGFRNYFRLPRAVFDQRYSEFA